MLNVLWLCSWYPTRVSPSNGDFVERHAIATSSFVKLTILCVEKDASLPPQTVQAEKTEEHGFTVYRVFYGGSGKGGMMERLFSFRQYRRLQKQFYRQIEQERGRPDIVHVHVAMKAGLLAGWLKQKEGIPYVVTEHWTGYYPQSEPGIYTSHWLLRSATKRILQNASRFLPVSKALGETIARHFTDIPYQAVPNVVDTSKFYYKDNAKSRFRFVHVSYMNFQKNPEGILQAAAMLKERGLDFELQMTGNRVESLSAMAEELGLLHTHVFFEDAIPYESVATRMEDAHAFLLFSRFENLPCVILEALCCGLPVISTKVGGVEEVINPGNGILVDNGSVTQLADAMQKMIEGYDRYDRKQISVTAIQQFNYDTIGQTHLNIYRSI